MALCRRHARLAASKMAGEIKEAEESDDKEEIRAALTVALIRCRKIHEYLQEQLNAGKKSDGKN